MTDYERNIFQGRCPYTGKLCLEKKPCIRCRMDEEEKRLLDEMEKQEMLLEEIDDGIY